MRPHLKTTQEKKKKPIRVSKVLECLKKTRGGRGQTQGKLPNSLWKSLQRGGWPPTPLRTACLPPGPLLVSTKSALLPHWDFSTTDSAYLPAPGGGGGALLLCLGLSCSIGTELPLAFPVPCRLEISIGSGTLRIQGLNTLKYTSSRACYSSNTPKLKRYRD